MSVVEEERLIHCRPVTPEHVTHNLPSEPKLKVTWDLIFQYSQQRSQSTKVFLAKAASSTKMSQAFSENSFIVHDPSPPSTGSHVEEHEDELDSLPSISDSEMDSDDVDAEAEREWRESLQQLQLLLTLVLVPYIGKYFGRKCAYWGKDDTKPLQT